jgi:hypothetical protein
MEPCNICLFYMGIYGASKYIQFDTIKHYNGKVSNVRTSGYVGLFMSVII